MIESFYICAVQHNSDTWLLSTQNLASEEQQFFFCLILINLSLNSRMWVMIAVLETPVF